MPLQQPLLVLIICIIIIREDRTVWSLRDSAALPVPASMKRLQVLVEEGCDEVDYYGSPIYDEYPDQVMVRRLCARIAERAAADERIQKDWGEELAGASCHGNPRLCDLVDLLAMNELYRRRCRNRCQRRRFY